jgi:hypothetical protein
MKRSTAIIMACVAFSGVQACLEWPNIQSVTTPMVLDAFFRSLGGGLFGAFLVWASRAMRKSR